MTTQQNIPIAAAEDLSENSVHCSATSVLRASRIFSDLNAVLLGRSQDVEPLKYIGELLVRERNGLQLSMAVFLLWIQHPELTNTRPIDLDKAWQYFEEMQRGLRVHVKQIFDSATQSERQRVLLQQQMALEEANKRFQAAQQPHAMGTVAEIAAKYGVSKSEVRRLKAEGRLHELQTKEAS